MGKAARAVVGITLLASIALGSVVAVPIANGSRPADSQPVNLGFTFSERQAGYLDLSWRQAFSAAMDLMPETVRFAAYWDSIERAPGQYDFTNLDWMLDNTPAQSSVVLTVGMKAPRWPEYYLPAWLQKEVKLPADADVAQNDIVRAATLRFVAQVVQHERGRSAIKYWQVENEPLDPSGPHQWSIDGSFLAEEVGLVRSLDSTRPIVINEFVDTSPLGLLPPWRTDLETRTRQILRLADILGLDVYPIRPVVTPRVQLTLKWPVWVWESRVLNLQRLAQEAGKQTWISEAQAEPWLPARLAATGSSPARNAAPNLTTSTVDRLHADGFNTILLWGVEYWYMRSERYKDGNWWSQMLSFFPGATSGRTQAGTPPTA
jgi:hypothetical protein